MSKFGVMSGEFQVTGPGDFVQGSAGNQSIDTSHTVEVGTVQRKSFLQKKSLWLAHVFDSVFLLPK